MSTDNLLADDLAILAEFVDESESDLNRIANLFIELEKNAGDMELVNSVFRPIHSIKGNSAFLGLMSLRVLAHEMESVLDDVRKALLTPTNDTVTILLAGVDEIKAMLARIRVGQQEVLDPSSLEALVKRVRSARSQPQDDATIPKAAPQSPKTPAPAVPAATKTAAGTGPTALPRTLRVQESLVEEMQALVADLDAAHQKMEDAVIASQPMKPESIRMMADQTIAIGEVLKKLNHTLLAFRKVPIGDLMQRAPRIIREAAAATGKTVNLVMAGEDVMMPVRYAKALEAPLMHMLRNAVDHGIEIPVERRRVGKAQEGTIRLEVSETGEHFNLRIADDGAGIDFKSLLKKAMEMGLCKGRQLTPDDVINLIFLPGVSGAKKVSDLSGRGVGMDVVKTHIDEIGGKILVNTQSGKGTEFTIRLAKE